MSNQQSQSSPVVAPVGIKLLDTKQAAQVLGVSWRTVQNLIASGLLPSITIGRSRRIRVADLDDFAQNGAARIAKTIAQPSADDVARLIDELAALDTEFSNGLSDVLTAHKAILNGESFTAQQLRQHRDAAAELLKEHVADKRVTRFLSAAMASFMLGIEQKAA